VERKYKWFLTAFYGFVFLVSIRGILIRVLGLTPEYSRFIFAWSFQMYLAGSIIAVLVLFSIISIILVLRKKLPKFNLVFSVYYLLLIFMWGVVKPEIISMITDSIEEYIRITLATSKYWLVFSIINFIFSGGFLWNLWFRKKEQNEKFK